MGFCPNCRFEYESQVKRCPDCDRKLVDHLEPEDWKDPDPDLRFVPLPGLPGRVYAEMIKEVLEKRGIPCYIRSDGITDALKISGTGPMSKGVVIYVPENRLKECEDIQHQMLDHI